MNPTRLCSVVSIGGTGESLLAGLFQCRFSGSGQLQGHSFGNLFLSALAGITGDFLKAVGVSSDVLAVRGKIYPSTLQDVHLEATMVDGRRVRGESAISKSGTQIAKIALSPPNCRPVPAVLRAIRNADLITVGPGSLYTSLLPNLLVRGIAKEMRASRALKIMIGNLMTQPSETVNYSAADHVRAIHDQTGGRLFDAIIVNTKPIPPGALAHYSRGGAEPVVTDHRRLRDMGLRILKTDLLAPAKVVRHDPDLLADAVCSAYRKWHGSSNTGRRKARSHKS